MAVPERFRPMSVMNDLAYCASEALDWDLTPEESWHGYIEYRDSGVSEVSMESIVARWASPGREDQPPRRSRPRRYTGRRLH